MPRKKKDPGDRLDVNELGYRTIQAALGNMPKPLPPEEREEKDKSKKAVERGRKGGKKGGPARAKKLTQEQREEAAQIAALARWKKAD